VSYIEYELLGLDVSVSVSDDCESVTVAVNGKTIAVIYGDLADWSKLWGLTGAAKAAAEHKILRQIGNDALANLITDTIEVDHE